MRAKSAKRVESRCLSPPVSSAVPATISSAIPPASTVKATRPNWCRNGQIRLARGINGKESILTLAGAGRLHAFNIAEGHVQQAALSAVGGRKSVWNSRPDDLVGSNFRLQAKFLGTQSLEVSRVEAHQILFPLIEAENLRRDRLQGAQQLAVVLGNQRHVRARQLHVHHACFQTLGVLRAVSRSDAVLQAQPAEAIEVSEESGYLLCGLLQIGNWHDKSVSQNRAGDGLLCVQFLVELPSGTGGSSYKSKGRSVSLSEGNQQF